MSLTLFIKLLTYSNLLTISLWIIKFLNKFSGNNCFNDRKPQSTHKLHFIFFQTTAYERKILNYIKPISENVIVSVMYTHFNLEVKKKQSCNKLLHVGTFLSAMNQKVIHILVHL